MVGADKSTELWRHPLKFVSVDAPDGPVGQGSIVHLPSYKLMAECIKD